MERRRGSINIARGASGNGNGNGSKKSGGVALALVSSGSGFGGLVLGVVVGVLGLLLV